MAIILVNWDAFNAQQALVINTLLDRKKSLYGRELPAKIKVLSLCSSQPKDSSFISRHEGFFSLALSSPGQRIDQDRLIQEKAVIDVKGYKDWQAYLFGLIQLQAGHLVWQPGPLTTSLSLAKKENKAYSI